MLSKQLVLAAAVSAVLAACGADEPRTAAAPAAAPRPQAVRFDDGGAPPQPPSTRVPWWTPVPPTVRWSRTRRPARWR